MQESIQYQILGAARPPCPMFNNTGYGSAKTNSNTHNALLLHNIKFYGVNNQLDKSRVNDINYLRVLIKLDPVTTTLVRGAISWI